tara:strand:+ start:159 stop:3671 length:3513 start_codon:yes stop_codon:yes gene_type:complete
MSIGLHTNTSGQEAARLAGSAHEKTQRVHGKLSSGNRIVHGYDDAGAYSVSQKMGAEIKQKLANYHNLQNVFSFLQTQDGVLGRMQEMIERMMVLKTRHDDIIKRDPDKDALNHEFEELQDQLSGMLNEKFNGISLFDMEPVADPNGLAMVNPNHVFEVATSDPGIGVIRISRHGIFENLKGKYGPDAVLNTQSTATKTAYDGGDGGTGSHSVLPTVKFSGGGGGVGAAAVVTVNDVEGHPFQGKITSITLANPGNGYTSNPTVAVTGMGGGTPATITAVVDTQPGSPTEGQIIKLEGLNSGEILSYNPIYGSPTPAFNSDNFIRNDGGTGYTGATAYAYVSPDTSGVETFTLDVNGKGYAYDQPFSITFENGGGYGATAQAVIVNGEVDSLTLTNGGQDYDPADFSNLGGTAMVSFTGGGGRGAKFTANIDAATGQITGFNKIDGGSDYSSVPAVRIAGAGGFNDTEHAEVTLQTSPTGTQLIDNVVITNPGSGFGTTVTFSSGSAEAVPSIDYNPTSPTFGQVTNLSLVNGGSGYGAAPNITVSGPGSNTSATFQALMAGLAGSSVASSGSGYDLTTQLEVVGGGGSGAIVSPVLTDDGSGSTFSITGFSITNAGSGYTSNPVVQVKAGTGGTGSGFSGTATAGTGQVTGFQQISGGAGYAPTVTVDAPDDPTHPSSQAAVLQAVVQQNPAAANFGEILQINILDGGRGYVDDSFDRNITVTSGTATANATVPIDPGELSLLTDDNGTPLDPSDDIITAFQTDVHGYDKHGTGYSKTPDAVISAPIFAGVPAAVQAAATATIAKGEIQALASTNPGTGFAETATLSVSGASGGLGADVYVDAVNAATGTLQSILINNGGSGYQVGDAVIFTGNGHGSPQAEVSSVDPSTGEILAFTIINGGSGFQPLEVNVDAPASGTQSVGFANIDAAGEVTSIDVRHHGFGYQYGDGDPDGDVAPGGDTDPTVIIGDDSENWEYFGGNPIAQPDYVSIFSVARFEPNKELTFTRRDHNGIVHTTGAWRHDPGPDGLYQFPAAPPHGLNSQGQGNDVYQDANTEHYSADYDNNNDLLNPLFALKDFSIRDFEDFLETLSSARATNAASSQRVGFAIQKVLNNYSDLEMAHGRITQADIAREMGHFSRFMVLGKSALNFTKTAAQMHEIAFKLLKEGL